MVLLRFLALLAFSSLAWRLLSGNDSFKFRNDSRDGASAGVNSLVDDAIHESLRVWKWEISSGHYPTRPTGGQYYNDMIQLQFSFLFSYWRLLLSESKRGVVIGQLLILLNQVIITLPPSWACSRDLPYTIIAALRDGSINNPALPNETIQDAHSPSAMTGTGFQRQYLDPRTIGRFAPYQNSSTPSLFPKRPPPGSIADFDVIMRTCDYENGKTSRDCLEFLRRGAGLDDANLLQLNLVESSYIYTGKGVGFDNQPVHTSQTSTTRIPSQLMVPSPFPYYTYSDLSNPTRFGADGTPGTSISATQASISPCDPNHPRIFHLFWSGPFTSHTYMSILSFLYTQNLGLGQSSNSSLSNQGVCRPKLWVWIWDPHTLFPDANAERELYRNLASNIWSRPFLHSRFHGIIEFKLWDVAKQLDAMGDILQGWREVLGLAKDSTLRVTNEGKPHDKSSSKFVTVVSDMARFVITYLYGGIYIDADTIFLRDWEELWGYRGAFAYRWSHIKNEYNTAVLKMNKGSMLGEMLIRAARRGPVRTKWWDWRKKNDIQMGMEFHPKEGISKYVEEMDLVLPVESNGRKGLLWMLPVALFDPAWLATDGYERRRMTVPGFKSFSDFFDTPSSLRHEAELLGFDGFFRGAYAYHWHNQWQTPFDKEQKYPNWGNKLAEHANELKRLYSPLDLNSTHAPDNQSSSHPVSTSHWTSIVSYLSFSSWKWSCCRHSIESVAADADHSLPWSAIIKRTMEAFIRGEAPNLYGEYFVW